MGVNCVYTGKEFKNTAKRLNIHPDSLEVYVHSFLNTEAANEYLEATGELPFPTDLEIREFFSLEKKLSGKQAIDTWVAKYGATDGFILDSELNEAVRLFGSGNVLTYKNYTGNTVHRVLRPTIDNREELKELLLKLYIIDSKENLLGISREEFYNRMRSLAIPASLYMQFDTELKNQVSVPTEEDSKTPMEVENTKWEAIFQEHENTIEFIEDSHEYRYYPQGKEHPESRVKMDTSVTSITNPVERKRRDTIGTREYEQDGLSWLGISAPIGTSADTVVRDFFLGIDITSRKYPNFTIELLKQLSKDLTNFKRYLDKKFNGVEYVIKTTPFSLIGKITDKNGIIQTIGGTVDIIIYDELGFYYIYDIKTSRKDLNNTKDPDISLKRAKYTSQLNTYSLMLEAMHPELKGCCGGLGILFLEDFYATPKNLLFKDPVTKVTAPGTTRYTIGTDKQLQADGQPIETNKNYIAPHFIDGDVQKAVINVEEINPRLYTMDGNSHEISISALDVKQKKTSNSTTSINTREDNLSKATKIPKSDKSFTGRVESSEIQQIIDGDLNSIIKSELKIVDYYKRLKEGDVLELHTKDYSQSILVKITKALTKLGNEYALKFEYINDSYAGTYQVSPSTPVSTRTAADNRSEATVNKKNGKNFSANMWEEYEDNKRDGVTSETTLDAIVAGERTATTRWKHIEGFYDQMKEGDLVEFHDNNGRSVLVKITKAPHKLDENLDMEKWSEKEGWSTEYFENNVLEHVEAGEAYQMEYEYVDDSYVNPETPARSRISNITISYKKDKDNYKKGTPQKHKDTAYIFTENAQAHNKLEGKNPVGPDTFVILNVNAAEKGRFNQADIRTNAKGEKTENAFGLIVKKYLLKTTKDWAAQEGCFENTDEDFRLFKQMNLEMFESLEKSEYNKMIFPFEVALGKAALPKRFATWLLKQLESRYGIVSTVEQNKTSGYKGYGLRVSEVIEAAIQINRKLRAEQIAESIELGENLDKDTAISTVLSMENNSNPEFNDADNAIKKSLGNKPLKVVMASEHTDPSFHSNKICKLIKEDRQRPAGQRKYHMLQIMTKHDGLPLLDMLELDIPKSVHISITSLGGTKWEPGVMKTDDLLDRIEDYIKQGKLNPNTTTIRIDPIIPGLTKEKDIKHIVERAKSMGIRQFKMSIMDSYGYDENALNRKVMEKMVALGYDFDKYYTKYVATLNKSGKFVQIKGNTYYGQDAKPEVMLSIYEMVEKIAEECDVRFNTCGEKPAKGNYKKISFALGCLSAKGVSDVLGLKEEDVKNNTEEGNQRVGKCHCLNSKVDALAYNDTCLSACAYCYAEHGSDSALQYYNEDGTLRDTKFTQTRRGVSTVNTIGPETKINIYAGTGENADLSNFAVRPFEVNGISFQSVEQGFLYSKFDVLKQVIDSGYTERDAAYNDVIQKIEKIHQQLLDTKRSSFNTDKDFGARLKSIGGTRIIANDSDLQMIINNFFAKDKVDGFTNWEKGTTASNAMKMLIKSSFQDAQNSQALQRLLATGNATLTHTQDESKWGTEFPKLLMEVREELRKANGVSSNTEERLFDDDGNPIDTNIQPQRAVQPIIPEDPIVTDIPPKKPLYTAYELELIKQRKALNALRENGAIFKPIELNDLAKACMYLVSDFISLILSNKDNNEEWFKYLPDSARKKELMAIDFTEMDRFEICHKLGMTMYEVIRQKYFNAANNPNGFNMDFDLLDKLELINENWNAFLEMGQNVVARLEEIEFDNTKIHVINETEETFNSQNVEEITEIAGSAVEHWQVSFRQVSAHASLSQLIKRTIGTLYKLDENGEKVLNKFGIPERLNESVVVNQILMWTQGSENLSLMVEKLKELEKNNPWVSQLTSKLDDNSEDETFKAQFWSNFKKYFQPYIILYQKPILGPDGKPTGSVLTNKVINQKTLEKQMLDDFISTLQSRLSEQEATTLYEADGTVNKKTVALYGKDLQKLLEYLDTFKENKQEVVASVGVKEAIGRIYSCFEIELDEDTKQALAENYDAVADIVKHAGFIKTRKGLDLAVKNNSTNLDLIESHRKDLESLFKHVVDNSSTTLESVAYEDGKLHYSYVVPSYLSNLVEKLKGNTEDYQAFLEHNYGQYGWFKIGDLWRNEWLKLLDENENYREEFQHAIVLTTAPVGNAASVGYRDKSPMLYAKSMLLNYFYGGSKSKWAFYRIPIMSNKPSEEYLRFIRYTDPEYYQDTIANLLVNVALQEIDRIATVRQRNEDSDTTEIKSFDKIGSKFLFLDYLQPILEEYQEWQKLHKGQTILFSQNEYGVILNERLLLGQMLEQRILGTENYDNNEALFNEVLTSVIKKAMRQKFLDYLQYIKEEGLLEQDKLGNYIHLRDLKMIDGMNTLENLENFFWNDTFAAINILQLTVTDIAYYKNAEDLQKRLAQIHAPGLRGNALAKWKGQPITDGKTRTIYIADFDKVVSDAIENIKQVFETKASKLDKTNPDLAALVRKQAKHIIEAFEDINVTDALGYNSPTSYRKKAIAFGKWSDLLEDVYNKIRSGEYDTRDLEIMMQPLKPFIYSNATKQSVGRLGNLKVGMQNKNSEYLLLMMDAILQGEENNGNPTRSKLAAIYQVMEESHYDAEGNYKTDGIDTVQFNSTVKAGEMGVIDINDASTTLQAKSIIERAIYKNTNNKSLGYNLDNVHVLEFEDYCIQNEVPAHLDGESIFGSQMRILSISDMPEMVGGIELYITYRGRQVSLREVKQNYMKAIADNINESLRELEEKFNIEGNRAERNIAISKLLLEQIKGDSRFGYDLLYSVCTDENGNFNIPLSDPINAGRVLQLLHSIIKTRINKQMIDGGPVVQVTNFGTSKELDIVFKDAQGNRLKTLREWFAEQDFSEYGSPSYEEFAVMHRYKNAKKGTPQYDLYHSVYTPLRAIVSERYLKEVANKQAGIMYIECYAPSTVFKQFADENGVIDLNKIPDSMKELIGFRIPTEFKYSMAPLKIVGLLPAEAGEGIMLPKDITILSGSDFDIDKLYIIRPVVKLDNFKLRQEYRKLQGKKYDTKAIWDDIYLNFPEIDKEIERAQKEMYQEWLDAGNTGSFESYLEYAKKHGIDRKHKWLLNSSEIFNKILQLWDDAEDYVIDKGILMTFKEFRESKKSDASYYVKVENDNTKDGRDNIIFDTIWAMLTSEQAMDLIFTPGNFDEPKKYGYIAEALRLHPEMSYKEIQEKYNTEGVDGLKDLINKSKNLVYNNTHLAFHKQNMVAGKLIGIFAQNNVSHSIISLIDQTVKTDDQGNVLKDATGKPKLWKPTILIEEPILEIEGKQIGGEEVPFDTLMDKNGNRISNTLAAFLAASVDAVKDPVLNYMNINETTAGILTSLIRMGYDTELAMLFLTLPIIKKVITQYAIANEESYKSLEELIEETINEINTDDISILDLPVPSLSKQTLIKTLRKATPTLEINLLNALAALNKISRVTSAIVSITKFNSVTAAAGPMLSTTMLMRQRVYDNLSLPELSTASMQEALDNPIIKAFRNAEFTAVDEIFDGAMLQASEQFNRLFYRIQDAMNGNMDEALVNKLADFYIAFVLAKGLNPIFKTKGNSNPISEERRKYIYKSLPWEIKKLLKTSNNRLLKLIKIMPKDESHEYWWMKINTRGMNGTTHDDVGLYWQELYLENPNIAMTLIEYNFVTSGLGFTPNSFANLIPIALKKIIPNYVEALSSSGILNGEEEDRFVDLFVRNNHQSSRIFKKIPKLKKNDIFFGLGYVTFSDKVYAIKKGKFDYQEYVSYNGRIYQYNGQRGNWSMYTELSKLGGKYGEILEINPSGPVEHIDLKPKNTGEKKSSKTDVLRKKLKLLDEDFDIDDTDENEDSDVEIEELTPKKKNSISNAMIAQIQWFILNKVPEALQNDRIKKLNGAFWAKDKDAKAPENALRALLSTSDTGYNKKAFARIKDIGNVVFNAVKGLPNVDSEELLKKINDIIDTENDLNICE